MVRRLLITTALEETWRDGEPVLFLGEWCRLYRSKDQWSRMDVEVLPYHWDDRAKLYADYQYLQAFYERLLMDLAEQLNRIHRVDHGVRYWRILIGPWLGYFTQMLFDRWTSIQQAVAKYELSGTIVLTGRDEALVPNDMTDFIRQFLRDEWNHNLYAEVLQRHTTVPCIKQERRENENASQAVPAIAAKQGLRRKFGDCCARAAGLFSGQRDAFFHATMLPLRQELRLHMRLGQLPQVWRSAFSIRAAVDWTQRKWIVAGDSSSEFEACARFLIPRQIPSLYLEGYGELVELTQRLPWPKRPRVIWSSNSFISDDVFKVWAAERAERGSTLMLGQHGGHYGIGKWSFIEDHEIAISDSYLSWGWTESGKPNVKPMGQLAPKRPCGIRHEKQPSALLVTCIVPRQSYWMYSIVVGPQWLSYFEDQCVFVQNLPARIRGALTVRLDASDYGWNQAMRWGERFPDLQIDAGQSDINDLIRRSRLYIATYNATTFLESFNLNVPTVIYWNPIHWELRDSAIPYFDGLKRVGIFHETPESAARHVATIWDDIDAWWGSAAVRYEVEMFKARFCDLPDNLLDRIEIAIRDAMTA